MLEPMTEGGLLKKWKHDSDDVQYKDVILDAL